MEARVLFRFFLYVFVCCAMGSMLFCMHISIPTRMRNCAQKRQSGKEPWTEGDGEAKTKDYFKMDHFIISKSEVIVLFSVVISVHVSHKSENEIRRKYSCCTVLTLSRFFSILLSWFFSTFSADFSLLQLVNYVNKYNTVILSNEYESERTTSCVSSTCERRPRRATSSGRSTWSCACSRRSSTS